MFHIVTQELIWHLKFTNLINFVGLEIFRFLSRSWLGCTNYQHQYTRSSNYIFLHIGEVVDQLCVYCFITQEHWGYLNLLIGLCSFELVVQPLIFSLHSDTNECALNSVYHIILWLILHTVNITPSLLFNSCIRLLLSISYLGAFPKHSPWSLNSPSSNVCIATGGHISTGLFQPLINLTLTFNNHQNVFLYKRINVREIVIVKSFCEY